MASKYEAPGFKADAFNCPYCGAYAHQEWHNLGYHMKNWISLGFAGQCSRCRKHAIWYEEIMIYPISSTAPLPVENMPEDVKKDFEEARNVVSVSPRSAAALLRLALEKLAKHLKAEGKDLNERIGHLVNNGLPRKIQQALDSVRVIGNNAVHPGQIDLRDDQDTAISLFALMNIIVEVMITQEKEIEEIYEKIPESTKKAISKRDSTITPNMVEVD